MIPLRCGGFLEGSLCPHFDKPFEKDGVTWTPDRAQRFDECLSEGAIPFPALGLDEHAALHFVDELPPTALCSVAGATAWEVGAEGRRPMQAALLQ